MVQIFSDEHKMMIGQLCNLMRVSNKYLSSYVLYCTVLYCMAEADRSLVMQGRAPSIPNNSAQYVLQIHVTREKFEKISFILVQPLVQLSV